MALLPPEITDRIIDFLHDDREALYACCLVCREWVPSCRTHLFWTIDLPKKGKTTFLRLLEFTPQIGLYVRVLSVYSDAPLEVNPGRLVNFWLSLKNLSKLHINAYRMRTGLLVALLSSLPSLKELSLQFQFFDPGDRPIIIVPNKIQSLRITTSDLNFFKWSIDRNIFPQIQTFEYHEMFVADMEGVISLHKFLKEYCLCLVHVRLDRLRPTLSEQLFDCLGLLINLQNLFVEVRDLPITAHDDDERRSWRISDIPRFLDCITSRSLISISWGIEFDEVSEARDGYDWDSDHLEELYINFDIPGFTQVWEEVCRMLAAPRFSTVKTVGLSVRTYLFDNRRRYFRPLSAFGDNGHVNLLWVNPQYDIGGATANHWRRMVLGSP